MEKNKKTQNGIIRYVLLLMFGKYLTSCFTISKKKEIDICKNFKEFIKEQEREIHELRDHEESFPKYIHDSSSLFEEYFIPYHGNNYKPKILHTRSLLITALVLLTVKLFISGFFLFSSPFGGKMAGEMTDQILTFINKERKLNNLQPLKLNSSLSRSASAKAGDMIFNNYFAHYSPDGKKPWDWVNRTEYPYIFVGENLAMNFVTPESAHSALMLSPTHKKNILGNKYTDVGLAVMAGQINGKNTNVLVQLFAARKEPIVTKAQAATKISAPTPAPKIINVAQIPKSSVKTLGIENTTKDPVIKNESIKSAATQLINKTPELKIVDIASSTISSSSEITKNELLTSIDEVEENNLCDDCNLHLESTNEISPALLNNEVISINPESPNKNKNIFLLKFSNIIYISILILTVVALLLKIFINITIQHKPVIAQTIVLLIFILGLIHVNSSILEYVRNSILIM